MVRRPIGPVALWAFAACTGGMYDPATVEQQNGACIALEGRTFTSLGEFGCGVTPDGAARCHWEVTFASKDATASDFAWSYSDVTDQGRVECRGESIKAAGPRAVIGAFDPTTQILTWGGETYVAMP